ncbi:MAG: acylphosphatase [Ardenticatenaceae bacterium]|nr:acylphosphatase [Ardenticatenaceae bacterium]
MKRIEAIVHGLVQGVSFRQYTQHEARQLGLVGWVRNEPDRTVRVVAEGDESALQKLAEWLHIGSPYGRVDKVDVKWGEATADFTRFEVRWYG